MLTFNTYLAGKWISETVTTRDGEFEYAIRYHFLVFSANKDYLQNVALSPIGTVNEREFLGVPAGFLRVVKADVETLHVAYDALAEQILRESEVVAAIAAVEAAPYDQWLVKYYLKEQSGWPWGKFVMPGAVDGRADLRIVRRLPQFDIAKFCGSDTFPLTEVPPEE